MNTTTQRNSAANSVALALAGEACCGKLESGEERGSDAIVARERERGRGREEGEDATRVIWMNRIETNRIETNRIETNRIENETKRTETGRAWCRDGQRTGPDRTGPYRTDLMLDA